MNTKIGGAVASAIVIIILVVFLGLDSDVNKSDNVFHVTLADPEMYENGVFTDSFEIDVGSYQFGFVPNGDSPQTLTISLSGPSHYSIEKFVLNSESHETGISQYYTWSYVGDEQSTIEVSSAQKVQITINPHENYNGPVSVFLKRQK
ncbi:MAG: hypothetical protein ACE5R3_01740 [Nitrosopumilaceae archaeon]